MERERESAPQPVDVQPSGDGLKEWEAPELTVEDVVAVTQGGRLALASPGDDTWYRS